VQSVLALSNSRERPTWRPRRPDIAGHGVGIDGEVAVPHVSKRTSCVRKVHGAHLNRFWLVKPVDPAVVDTIADCDATRGAVLFSKGVSPSV